MIVAARIAAQPEQIVVSFKSVVKSHVALTLAKSAIGNGQQIAIANGTGPALETWLETFARVA
jgi:hypothetical protein